MKRKQAKADNAPAAAGMAFQALRHKDFRAYLATYLLAMMADNIEHVISYWVAFQKFHSATLGGVAVLAHWLPFLLLSVPVGGLAERTDPRRVIQAGMAIFIGVSLGWGFFIWTDTLEIWKAVVLLILHGIAGVLWQTASQMLLYEIVPPDALQSAVRSNATARYLGLIVGPAVGGFLMQWLGPVHGIFANALFYVPLVLWLLTIPHGRAAADAPRRAVRGLRDIVQTIADIRHDRLLVSMILLAGGGSFFIGNSYQAQMPNFAADLGHGDVSATYSMLLAADAAGALCAGLWLEARGRSDTGARKAILLAACWCLALTGFALAPSYPVALIALFAAGVFELSFSSMAQSLVQVNAAPQARGRVIGLFNMSALGMRAFSGITVGLMGSVVGVHASLAWSALAMLVFAGLLARYAGAARDARAPG
ncbi:Predicted arabinose efflux permease, MFS family [Noviherbaspirillum humi]|uniref:Predicted arabinose efflux permease, MFS family n=1 Tax=Noviherbaspirillum humi TaxID=1688639 RepID=A0A239I0L2_9BURK|nr:MFS transporter [Noviherbaspirillum humi]SNS87356.1 Predicted arabinose efflux permease, MFS family [Noviherbaspirillum humi]